ncbi:MAG TPA: PAS domain-containing sensor histidine kinase, partial [Flavisolibacter sp.]
YLRVFKLTKKIIGQSLECIFPAPVVASLKENNELVYRSGQPVQFTEHITTPDGVSHMYQVIKFPVASDDDQLIGGWAIDVTEENDLRKSLSESLNNLKESEANLKNALLKELNLHDMKSRFVSMASHEFRTPLSTMLSSVYLVEKYVTTEQQVNRLKHTGKIKEAIQHMNDLLEDFLTLGKLDEGKTHVHKDNIHLHQLLTDLVEELQPVLKKGQTIHLQYSGSEVVTTDKKIIKNILINLLSNAIKFSAEDKTIDLTAQITPQGILLIVNDHGIGISNEDQTHLFQTFFRGRNAQNIPGTGLGLNIVQRYITLLAGKIDLRSILGKGTVVRVSLPYTS